MRRLMAGMGMLSATLFAGETINGAGATFPYPLYAKWAYLYYKETGVRLNYQSIGSGGGVRQIINRTVDFGASDAPLKPEETKKHKLAQFPTVVGGVVISYNLPIKELKLSTEAVCGIFLGKVKYWDDPLVKKHNPKAKLPHRKITVIRRSDGSGTTWIFTNYLAKACPEWKKKVGYGKAVNWPTGIGAKGNEGVANYLRRVRGGIGYVEFAYALENRLKVATLQNREGSFVKPSIETFQAAAAGAKWDPKRDFYEVLTWQKGKRAYPIAGATFILLAKDYPKDRNRKVVKFFDWAFKKGDKIATELHYVPLPKKVKESIRDYWRANGWY
ncbi:phosphate ABC transporter substrate-binding protein PstS [Hydrogenivirga sp. 128-5-R1-1]|uniref:phosphate ABC transporter substrate-binding protein PstS n=1 Tax=Hydrogenivirga sp. 128-5-R1-1 TaxID=392423 RepID=UPI00015F17F4|nr:phosphate ABC transporter substrate-binding protein PstS [Hydrogenivirga sp. 128-5-R1-1]EDP76026.1 phosphate-binding periplasmic protein [Hydrogenivirga sp. 128-5-R1-1]